MTAPRPALLVRRPEPAPQPDKNLGNYKKMLDDLIGTRGASLLDEQGNLLGKVPTPEVAATIKSLGNVHAVIQDGVITADLVEAAQRSNVKYLIATESKIKPGSSRVHIYTPAELPK